MEILADKKRSHGVSEDELRDLRIPLPQHILHRTHIFHDTAVAVFIREKTPILFCLDRLPMSEVVVAGDQNAFARQDAGETVIPVNKFHHAVRDLQNGTRRPIRLPDLQV